MLATLAKRLHCSWLNKTYGSGNMANFHFCGWLKFALMSSISSAIRSKVSSWTRGALFLLVKGWPGPLFSGYQTDTNIIQTDILWLVKTCFFNRSWWMNHQIDLQTILSRGIKYAIYSKQHRSSMIPDWWFQPLWKILVSWSYYSQYMEK